MTRSALETNIAKYTELKSDYSTQYPAESPTTATYIIKNVSLQVFYKEGLPAPYTTNNDGTITHQQPVEQTVLSWGVNE